MRKVKQSRKVGFTLIELLVVIAIIAVLAALLMPALERARDAARAVACMDQQRQTSITLMFYSDDFDGWLPKSRANTFSPTPYNGTQMVYAGPWGLVLACNGYISYAGDLSVNYEETGEILHKTGFLGCPSIEPIPLSEDLHQWMQTYGMRELAYGTFQDCWNQDAPNRINVNNAFHSAYPPQAGASSYPVGTECSKQYPGSKWWNLGCPYFEECMDLSYRAVFSWEGAAYRPHTDRGNVWFLDAHVESLDQAGLQALVIAPGDGDFNINWNDDMFENSWPRTY